MLISKIPTEIIENHSEFSGCPNSCNKLLQIDLDKLRNYLRYKKQLCWRWWRSGCKRTPKSFNLLKTWVKMPFKVLTSKNGAQGLQKNTWRTFLKATPKKGLKWSLWEKLCRQKFHKKTFRGSLGKFGKNLSRPQQAFACSYTMIKRHLHPNCPPFERKERELLPPCLHSPASLFILFCTL